MRIRPPSFAQMAMNSCELFTRVTPAVMLLSPTTVAGVPGNTPVLHTATRLPLACDDNAIQRISPLSMRFMISLKVSVKSIPWPLKLCPTIIEI